MAGNTECIMEQITPSLLIKQIEIPANFPILVDFP